MEKDALLERLVRLGATDVPNTPRLLMRKRSPEELAGLQHGVESAFGKLQGPAQAAVNSAADKVFTPRIAGALKSVASVGIKNPEIIPMQGVPVPGLTPAYLAGKRGLEKLIDKVAPIAKHAFTTSQYSYPLNPSIPSQASHQPGFLAPNLQSAVQKRKQAAGAPTRGGFFMSSDIPSFAAPDLKSPIQKRSDAGGMSEPAAKVASLLELFGPFEFLKIASEGVSVGQWWEQKGGPHLAKGGSHSDFKKMMETDGIPEKMHDRFMRMAKERYPAQHNFRNSASHVNVDDFFRKHRGSAHPTDAVSRKINLGVGLGAAAIGGGIALHDYMKSRGKKKKAAVLGTAGAVAHQAKEKGGDLDMAFCPAPSGKTSKEKDSDMLPDYVTYNQGDFKRSKFAMPVEEMAAFVEQLRKVGAAGGIMGVSATLSGAPAAAKSVGAPKLSGPGPSIAQIAKPKGPGFGSGIAGAFKGSIGGRGPQDLS